MNVFPACNRLVCYKHKWKLTGIAFNCLSLSGIFNAEPCWQESGFATWHAIILFHSQNMAFLQCNSFGFSLRKFTTWGMMEQEEMQFHSTRVSSKCFQTKKNLYWTVKTCFSHLQYGDHLFGLLLYESDPEPIYTQTSNQFRPVQTLPHHSILQRESTPPGDHSSDQFPFT